MRRPSGYRRSQAGSAAPSQAREGTGVRVRHSDGRPGQGAPGVLAWWWAIPAQPRSQRGGVGGRRPTPRHGRGERKPSLQHTGVVGEGSETCTVRGVDVSVRLPDGG
jgi:hypothetical protein